MIWNLHLIIKKSKSRTYKKKERNVSKAFLKERSKVLKRFETYIQSSKNRHPKSKPRTYKKKSKTLVKCFLNKDPRFPKRFETYIRSSKNNHPKSKPKSPEPTKRKVKILVKCFLKRDPKFRNDSKLTSDHLRTIIQNRILEVQNL